MSDPPAEALVLQPQVVPEAPKPKRRRRQASVCLKCWEPIVPLRGHEDLVGGFGHRADCPDRGIEPSAGELAGRWIYGEPGWDCPVILCETCGMAALVDVGEDENFVIMPAGTVEDWEWLQWLYEERATTCWDCGAQLPEGTDG